MQVVIHPRGCDVINLEVTMSAKKEKCHVVYQPPTFQPKVKTHMDHKDANANKRDCNSHQPRKI